MSASTDPDKAFDWISETWAEGRTMDQLRDVGKFNTLDAKLLSALTNILTGDFAERLTHSKKLKLPTNDMFVVAKFCTCYMTILAPISSMAPHMHFRTCSVSS